MMLQIRLWADVAEGEARRTEGSWTDCGGETGRETEVEILKMVTVRKVNIILPGFATTIRDRMPYSLC